MNLRIDRAESDTYGNFGFLTCKGIRPLFSCEAPWVMRDREGGYYPNGKRYFSCVPVGDYDLVMHRSPKYGSRWHLVGEGVTLKDNGVDRFACLFHSANHPFQLQGCPSLGMRRGLVLGRYGVENSTLAIGVLEGLLNSSETHSLTIR